MKTTDDQNKNKNDLTKMQVLRMLKEHIASQKQAFGKGDSVVVASGNSLDRHLTSYEIVANSEQEKYPVCDAEGLHKYLIDHDLMKRPADLIGK